MFFVCDDIKKHTNIRVGIIGRLHLVKNRCTIKLPLKNTGVTLKGPDGTVLVTFHMFF